MSELLHFPDVKGRHRREPLSAKHKVLRAASAGLFAISVGVGISTGAELIQEKHSDQQLASSEESTSTITSDQVHSATNTAILETISGTGELIGSIAGFTTAIGIGVVSAAATSRRREHETVPSVRFADDILVSSYDETTIEEQPLDQQPFTLEPAVPHAYPTAAQVSFDALDQALRDSAKPIYC